MSGAEDKVPTEAPARITERAERGAPLLDLKARWATMDARARLRAKQFGVAASVAVLGYGLYTASNGSADKPADAPTASKLDMGAGLRGDSLELKLRGDLKKVLDGQSLLGERITAIEEGRVVPGSKPGLNGLPADMAQDMAGGDLPPALPDAAPAFPPAPDTSAVEPRGDTLPPPPGSVAPAAPPPPPVEKTVGGIGSATGPIAAAAGGASAGPDAKKRAGRSICRLVS